ncbi:uncharacterized protein BO80DRAFT_205994 [Aspergillus ibericus CBS 121593]|uniref:Aminoglycoside phosphotransferase domain-containing protein n=1 Tax=Aspergillus ibericus CBS 121593 TaxID=1448316 RepID=A0A395HAQ9_9EURO|nr:hypothetical protein BO80DRAFT_205994 [Aspergillus ibericus CBS 121593]RAL04659.1 hypothetical protein BO80DRAFT_205994 [Aspergillus ibericus CBS 121593]
MDFLESSFFAKFDRCLPSLAEVRALSHDFSTARQPKPVVFEQLNLLVKSGRTVPVAEAQCLWMLRRVFGDSVPVPEVYGWRIENNYVFIYMELIHGRTLHECWDDLDSMEKTVLCDQLCEIVSRFRQLSYQPSDKYIGSVSRQRVHDCVFEAQTEAGPFPKIREFIDWFSGLPQARLPISERYEDPYRGYLPDDGVITFTHGVLHRSASHSCHCRLGAIRMAPRLLGILQSDLYLLL